jgi:hypothetical protein
MNQPEQTGGDGRAGLLVDVDWKCGDQHMRRLCNRSWPTEATALWARSAGALVCAGVVVAEAVAAFQVAKMRAASVSVEAAVFVADLIDVATQRCAAVVVGPADLRCSNAGVPARAIDASLTIGAVVVDAAAAAAKVAMRQVVRNGTGTDLDLDEGIRV